MRRRERAGILRPVEIPEKPGAGFWGMIRAEGSAAGLPAKRPRPFAWIPSLFLRPRAFFADYFPAVRRWEVAAVVAVVGMALAWCARI